VTRPRSRCGLFPRGLSASSRWSLSRGWLGGRLCRRRLRGTPGDLAGASGRRAEPVQGHAPRVRRTDGRRVRRPRPRPSPGSLTPPLTRGNSMFSSRVAALTVVPLVLVALGAAAPAEASPPGGSVTCRGEGVDPRARVRHRTEVLIHAPLRTVWRLQADVERWPSWQAPVTTAKRLDRGPLRRGSAFRWTTPAPATPTTPATTLVITSTVRQLQHHSCVRWTGPAIGEGIAINGVHVWNFTKVRGGTLVRTEETHTGPQVDANVPLATEILAHGLNAWLQALKATAEFPVRPGVV
jgi:uncharacterized membrane protein